MVIGFQVQGEAQGDDESVAKLVKDIWLGSPQATVKKLEVESIPIKQGESSFEQKA